MLEVHSSSIQIENCKVFTINFFDFLCFIFLIFFPFTKTIDTDFYIGYILMFISSICVYVCIYVSTSFRIKILIFKVSDTIL